MLLTDILENLHPFTRLGHIILGAVGLALFWLPLLTKKGQKLHRLFGRVFEAVAWGVIGLAGFGVISYLLRFWLSDFSWQENLSEFSLILMLGGLTFTAMTMLYQGRAALRSKDNVIKARSFFFLSLHFALFVMSLSLIIFALIIKPPNFIIVLITSLFGIAVAHDGYQFVKRDIIRKQDWVYAHLNGMMGTGLAFYVAFGVFGAKHFFRLESEAAGWINALPWLLPICVIVPIMMFWKRRVKRMFGKDLASGNKKS